MVIDMINKTMKSLAFAWEREVHEQIGIGLLTACDRVVQGLFYLKRVSIYSVYSWW